MANLFDSLRDSAFDRVAHTMGYTAIWAPSLGGDAQSAEVLFKDDTEAYQIEGDQYDPAQSRIEYRLPVFENLKPAVDNRLKEIVTIEFDSGAIEYWVQRVDTVFDGRTCIAYLRAKGDNGDFNFDYTADFNRVKQND